MSQTIIVKIGTSSLTQVDTGNPAISAIATLVETSSYLRRIGHRVILVSSGAVGIGCARLGMKDRPKTIVGKQAAAAVGQGRLMRVYDDLFSSQKQAIAQILLTRTDLVQRDRYLNAKNTFEELLRMGVIPIVNENDSLAVEELKFGDNDTLSAMVASLLEADWLFLLTDIDKLYSDNPRQNPKAKPITLVRDIDELAELQVQTGGSGTNWGTGGMASKIEAARIATSAGVRTVIAAATECPNIEKIMEGELLGTQFEPQSRTPNARKRWIAHGIIPKGELYLDDGAVRAICLGGKSLLAAGITDVKGEFQESEAVVLCDRFGKEVAKGLVNYSSTDIMRVRGCRSEELRAILGDRSPDTVVHRDNLVLN